jgi:hypothetical protein
MRSNNIEERNMNVHPHKYLISHNLIYFHVYDWEFRRGFGLEIGFIGHINTQLVTALNYSTIADFDTLPLTPSHAKSFPA